MLSYVMLCCLCCADFWTPIATNEPFRVVLSYMRDRCVRVFFWGGVFGGSGEGMGLCMLVLCLCAFARVFVLVCLPDNGVAYTARTLPGNTLVDCLDAAAGAAGVLLTQAVADS